MKAPTYISLALAALLSCMATVQADDMPPLAPSIQSLDSAIQKLDQQVHSQPAADAAQSSETPVSNLATPNVGEAANESPALRPAPAVPAAVAPAATILPVAQAALPANNAEAANLATAQSSTAQQANAVPAPAQPNFRSPVVFIYEFGAQWCPSCRKLAPMVEETAAKYEGFAEYIPVNVDKNQELVKQLKVAQIPTVMIIDKRGRMLNRLVGLQQGQQLEVILEHYKAQTIASLARKQQSQKM